MHKLIRNPNGTAYVVTASGRHVKTHDSIAEAKEHLEELNEEHKNKSSSGKEHEQSHWNKK